MYIVDNVDDLLHYEHEHSLGVECGTWRLDVSHSFGDKLVHLRIV